MISLESESSKNLAYSKNYTPKTTILTKKNKIGVESVWVYKVLSPHLHQHKFRRTLVISCLFKGLP